VVPDDRAESRREPDNFGRVRRKEDRIDGNAVGRIHDRVDDSFLLVERIGIAVDLLAELSVVDVARIR